MNTKEYIEKLKQDPEALYAVAVEAGVTDSFEVFKEELAKAFGVNDDGLNEEDLKAIAGGASGLQMNIGSNRKSFI